MVAAVGCTEDLPAGRCFFPKHQVFAIIKLFFIRICQPEKPNLGNYIFTYAININSYQFSVTYTTVVCCSKKGGGSVGASKAWIVCRHYPAIGRVMAGE